MAYGGFFVVGDQQLPKYKETCLTPLPWVSFRNYLTGWNIPSKIIKFDIYLVLETPTHQHESFQYMKRWCFVAPQEKRLFRVTRYTWNLFVLRSQKSRPQAVTIDDWKRYGECRYKYIFVYITSEFGCQHFTYKSSTTCLKTHTFLLDGQGLLQIDDRLLMWRCREQKIDPKKIPPKT